MLHSLFTSYDTHHPDLSNILVNSVKSYISSKLDNERRTPEFITEMRRRLYFIHEYNEQVAKVTQTYPRSRKFDKLLVKYVELEFEALYHNNPNPPKEAEVLIELRVLRLLQVMLYQTVLTSESLINENTDAILKKAVLRLLGDVKSSCLVENKLVHNIANKLLKKVNSRSDECNVFVFDTHEIHRSLIATSDYGTDDNDSDFENDVNKITVYKEKTVFEQTPDCVEVPLTENGVAPIPTIEFVDDDDDYMVYLQQYKKTCKVSYKEARSIGNNLCNTRNSHDKFAGNSNNDSKTCDIAQNEESLSKTPPRNNTEANCVILSSDEESSNLETQKKKKRIHRHTEENQKDKNNGVVTFELIDDDDENDHPTYMMYLQKEVETKKKRLSRKKLESEVIICSDSEDEVVEISEENNDALEGPSLNNLITQNLSTNNEANAQVHIIQQREEESFKNYNCDSMFDENTLDDILDLVDTRSFQDIENSHFAYSESLTEECCNMNSITSITLTPTEVIPEVLNSLNSVEIINKEADSLNTSISSQDSTHLLMLESKIGMNFCEESGTNFLIDPAAVFEEMSYPSMQSNSATLALNQYHSTMSESEYVEAWTSNSYFEVLCTDKHAPVGIIGGPVLSEKMDDSDDVDSLQEHSLNASILDLFLDDNYLLEGRKQFEELECFLFDENNQEELAFVDGANLFEEKDAVSPSVGVGKNEKNLEPLLKDSQTSIDDKEISPHEITSKPSRGFRKKRKRKCIVKRKHKSKKGSDKIKSDANFTNNGPFKDIMKNVSLTDFLRQTECNFKASGRRKSGKISVR